MNQEYLDELTKSFVATGYTQEQAEKMVKDMFGKGDK